MSGELDGWKTSQTVGLKEYWLMEQYGKLSWNKTEGSNLIWEKTLLEINFLSFRKMQWNKHIIQSTIFCILQITIFAILS